MGFGFCCFLVVVVGFFLLSATCFCGSERCCNVQMKIFLHPLLLKYFTWWLDSLNDVRNKCLPPSFLTDFFKRYSTKQVEFVFKNKEKENKKKKKKGGGGWSFVFVSLYFKNASNYQCCLEI